ncbi:MAG: FAD:protein FMN transferase [Lachnospiraceae bacterium]|nr:FAD:protein FMN transferase [Lachnospiraceae bacterium]
MKKAKKTIKTVVAMALAAALLAGCGPRGTHSEKPASASFFAMDTIMEISLYGDAELLSKAQAKVRELESVLSATSGEVARINKANDHGQRENRENVNDVNPAELAFGLSFDVAGAIESALWVNEFSGGLFDITIYPIMQLYGFGTDAPKVPSDAELGEYLKLVGGRHLNFNRNFDGTGRLLFLPGPDLIRNTELPGIGIDLGGIAKGYTGERLADMLALEGVTSAILNLGGNVQAIGTKPDGSLWRVGVADPDDTSKQIGYLDVKDCAVVTSGSYQRFFEKDGVRYHHILDPRTGKPANSGLKSVTVIHRNGTLCDGLSTAFFVAGLEKTMELYRANTHYDELRFGQGEEREGRGSGTAANPEDSGRQRFENNLLGGGFEIIFVLEDGSVKVTKGLKDIFVPIGVKVEVVE